MKTHELKIWPKYFRQISDRKKTFELRKNDRMFKVGEEVTLWEYDPDAKEYTGGAIAITITDVFGAKLNPFGIDLDGYVILSFKINFIVESE